MMKTEEYKRDPTARTVTEDSCRKLLEESNEFVKATLYWLLYAEGMRLDHAREIRRKAGATQ